MLHKKIFLSIAILGSSLILPVANANAAEDLRQICREFPLNSRCDVLDQPQISFRKVEGQKAKCLDNITLRMLSCKVNVTPTSLTIFAKVGEKKRHLGGKREVKRIDIPYSTINNVGYSESSKVNIGAVFAVGVWGLLLPHKRSSFDINYVETPSTEESGVSLKGDNLQNLSEGDLMAIEIPHSQSLNSTEEITHDVIQIQEESEDISPESIASTEDLMVIEVPNSQPLESTEEITNDENQVQNESEDISPELIGSTQKMFILMDRKRGRLLLRELEAKTSEDLATIDILD